MEPQFMILGHAAGVIAALTAKGGAAVQDVDFATLHATLLADGALLNQTAAAPRKLGYRCGANTCFPSAKDTCLLLSSSAEFS
jgi:malonyl CoA-acyl carrier protein transacylase